MKKIRILEVGNELGLGGTEYVIQLYSQFLDKEYFQVTVLGLKEGGVRAQIIEEMGIRVIILNGEYGQLVEHLRNTDVLHCHGDGSLDPKLFSIVQANRPKLVIQTNVFGLHTRSSLYDCIDYDLYVSKMILIRRMLLDEDLEDKFERKRKVLANPVDVCHITNMLSTEFEIKSFKKKSGLQDFFIVGRIGRSSDAKFDLITLDGFAQFAKNNNHARFLLVGATPNILEYARHIHILEKLIIVENTSDLKQLLKYYQAMDVFLAASRIGESFGLVIAEAMAAGIPVVTVSIPHKDNAQIDLVDNELTGLVVERNIDHIANALLYLYHNEHVRKDFGKAAKKKIWKDYRAETIVSSFEQLIYRHFNMDIFSDQESLIQSFSDQMLLEYARRCDNLWYTDRR